MAGRHTDGRDGQGRKTGTRQVPAGPGSERRREEPGQREGRDGVARGRVGRGGCPHALTRVQALRAAPLPARDSGSTAGARGPGVGAAAGGTPAADGRDGQGRKTGTRQVPAGPGSERRREEPGQREGRDGVARGRAGRGGCPHALTRVQALRAAPLPARDSGSTAGARGPGAGGAGGTPAAGGRHADGRDDGCPHVLTRA
ncbi:hypothetical protein Kpho01_15660 [Kitasatospora phosalacinea]|uniref:Uncharacterized protein n=1 Tax=Kitasatospora phosalacinea TaxID=2065 RepID=A0A9W6PCX6_9ACTN|nr:hypothetical protein Kpho01_15660 [Kitasatospora phosalacinea]